MSSFRSFVRTFAIAAACAFVVAPIAASAEEKPQSPRVVKVKRHHDKHDKGQFPMESAKFSEIVERKIERARAQMERILSNGAVPDGAKAQIRKDFDAAAVKVRAAAKSAGSDGKVTKEEAKDVRKQARGMVKELRAKYGKDKDKGHDKDD